MNTTEQPPLPSHPNLLLHCGAKAVTREQLEVVATPASTSTWAPIPHLELIEVVEFTLRCNGLTIGAHAHSLSREGARYFGLIEVTRPVMAADYRWVLGLRNSHDKTFPAGITAGASVLVCDNLSFSGEVKLARKHTRFISRDLPFIVQRAIGRLLQLWENQDIRLGAYKSAPLNDRDAHDLLVRAADLRVCPNALIPRVLREWRHPRHEAFVSRTLWSFFNAVTEALKGNLHELPRRTEALHGLLDVFVGLDSTTPPPAV